MSKRGGKGPDPLSQALPAEALAAYVSLGCQLAAQMAEANFRSITSAPGWTMAQVEDETEQAIGRMEIVSRDMLAAKGSDPDGGQWREVWTAMEGRYRETMAELLRGSGLRVGETLQ